MAKKLESSQAQALARAAARVDVSATNRAPPARSQAGGGRPPHLHAPHLHAPMPTGRNSAVAERLICALGQDDSGDNEHAHDHTKEHDLDERQEGGIEDEAAQPMPMPMPAIEAERADGQGVVAVPRPQTASAAGFMDKIDHNRLVDAVEQVRYKLQARRAELELELRKIDRADEQLERACEIETPAFFVAEAMGTAVSIVSQTRR